jgi:hypothetical protein
LLPNKTINVPIKIYGSLGCMGKEEMVEKKLQGSIMVKFSLCEDNDVFCELKGSTSSTIFC